YIDDIRIQDAPRDVVLAEPTNVTMHSADLSWTQNTDANFARYEVYRNKSAAATRSNTLVATITNQSNTAFTDVYNLLQPDRYHYQVWVVDQLGRYSLGSNDVTATYTVPQVGYPFLDNMEAGTAKWEWGSPWGQTTASAHSSSTSWSDSPVGAYADNTNTALTTTINLAQAGSPILTFWHRYSLEQNLDYGYVEVSTNGGNTWTQVFVVSGNGEWKWEKVNLKPYAGSVIGLRFRLASNANGITGDGWYIDDVNIAEGITSATYPFFDNMENGLGSWFYSSPWGQTTSLSHSAGNSWTDSPFGSYVNNTDTSLWTTINLSMAVMPVLDFWHKYSLEKNKDFGYIEASINGGSTWTRIYFVTGGNDWVNEKVDLSGYTGQAQVMLRFRLVSDASGTADGWYIDDVSINETPFAISYPFSDDMESGPGKWLSSSWGLVGPGNGSPNAWTDSPEGNYLNDNWMELVLGSVIDLRGTTKPQLTFWHKYDLVNTTASYDYETDYGRVYVSNYYGQSGSWQQLAAYTGTQSTWTRVKLDLSAYVGSPSVRIKFILDDNRDTETYYGGDQSHAADGWYIDDVRISEADTIAPAAVTNLSVGSVTANSATLVWTAPGDDLNTGTATQYDLRYLAGTPITEANWNTANQTTGEPAPLPSGFTQNYIVTGLIPDTTYYFAIKTVDEDLNWSPLSNVISGITLTEGMVTIRVDAPTSVLTQRDFTAKIRIGSVANFDAASYNVTFNSAVLQLTNVTSGLIGGTQIPVSQWNEASPGVVTVVQNVDGTPGISGSGYLAVLQFHVIGDNTTSSQIGLTNGILGNNQAQAIPSKWVADSVQVVTVLPGDANGDEAVNALDLTVTERIIVGLDVATPGADANKDGSVNALDLTLIERIIVGLQ
ncbi:MAG: immune inhibitor A, partial [Chloroflexi bacterium]|nr:immune inhibitor A [Chloroflexota bacterium]